MLTLKWYNTRLLSPNNIVSPEFVKDRQVVFLTLVLVPTFRSTVQHILRDKLMMPFSLKHKNIVHYFREIQIITLVVCIPR